MSFKFQVRAKKTPHQVSISTMRCFNLYFRSIDNWKMTHRAETKGARGETSKGMFALIIQV